MTDEVLVGTLDHPIPVIGCLVHLERDAPRDTPDARVVSVYPAVDDGDLDAPTRGRPPDPFAYGLGKGSASTVSSASGTKAPDHSGRLIAARSRTRRLPRASAPPAVRRQGRSQPAG